MADAPHYMIRRWTESLPDLFDEPDRQDVLDWLIANNGRPRVILVGAGFTLNAKRPSGTRIPLWKEMAEELAKDLRVSPHTYDALTLADFYRRNLGDNAYQSRMLNLLEDDLLVPGIAHDALWSSDPEAVITTNFIDTVLEKNSSSQRVIEDPDLALPLACGKRQLIYLHGHRSNFGSWVTGRSDYDDLPEKRSMLFARTRQLFAQFPLLAVGYSLTDPDFHLVYRQMVRAMDKRHPMGLAVVLPGQDSDAESAQRAARKYWEDLGLRVVRIRESKSQGWPAQFVSFFRLTKRVDRVGELREGLRRAASSADFPQVLEDNIQVWQSSQEDSAIDLVWQRDRYARAAYWNSVLTVARPRAVAEGANERSKKFNLSLHRSVVVTNEDSDSLEQHVPELDARVWTTEAGSANPLFGAVWSLFQKERGFDWVWSLEEALRSGADRDLVADWLRAAVERADILDAHNVQARSVLLALLMLKGFDADTVTAVGVKARARFNDIAGALKLEDGSPEKDSELVSVLKQARNKVEFGTRDEARKLYEQAVSLARECCDCNGPRLLYFALQGVADTTEESENRWRSFEAARDARGEPSVALWWERVKELEHDLVQRRSQALENALDSFGYEPSNWSSNNSGWSLNVIRVDADTLGAPLSVLSWLTLPLLGNAPSLEWELNQRLHLNIKETGKWVERHVRSGDLFRNCSKRPLNDGLLQGGASERRAGVGKLRSLLLVEAPSHQHHAALLDIVSECPEVLGREDVPVALNLVEQAWQRAGKPTSKHADALASISQLCDWQSVTALFESFGEPWILRRFAASKLPWEQWQECDGFLESGGLEFLRDLSADCHPIDWRYVGWGLVEVVGVTPEHEELIQLFAERLEAASNHEDSDQDVVLEHLANVYGCSARFRNDKSRAALMLEEAVRRDALHACRIIAQAKLDFELRAEARQRFCSAVGSNPDAHSLEDVALMTSLSSVPVMMPGERVWKELEETWRTLPKLASVLAPQFWAPSDWRRLGTLLRFGGHRGKPASWALETLRLLTHALRIPECRETVLSDQPELLGFLRQVPFTMIGSGDSVAANNAMYTLSLVGCHARGERDSELLASALRVAADDVRIGVVHGAAYVANYLLARTDVEFGEIVHDAAQEVAQTLADEPLAIVARQAAFGAARGARQAQQREDE